MITLPELQCMSVEQVKALGPDGQEAFRRGLIQAKIMASNVVYLSEKDRSADVDKALASGLKHLINVLNESIDELKNEAAEAEDRVLRAAETQVAVLFADKGDVDLERAASQELIDSVRAMQEKRRG